MLMVEDILWVSEQRLVNQANTIYRNSWMIEFEIEELERSLAGNDGYKEQERSADNTSNLEEEGIPIFEEIAEMLEGRKTSYQFLEI